MRAVKTLQQMLRSSLVSIHSARKKSVFWAVCSLVLGARLSLTGLGRSARGRTLTKHNIKRVDRLLQNAKLHAETPVFYRAIAAQLIGGKKHPVIAIDWTGAGKMHSALVAAVPFDGRAIPIYVRVYSYRLNNNSTVEKKFMQELKDVLPAGCRPVIATDSGYRNKWFKAVLKLGWDFVGRIQSAAHARPINRDKWCSTHSLFKKATTVAKDLGDWWLTKSNTLKVRFVLIKNKPTKRLTKRVGQKAGVEARNRAKEPWLLATSLTAAEAKKVVHIYSVRFQIEEFFRDTKNSRFGWSFNHARSRDDNRIEVLLLIATLGMICLTLVGHAAESKGLHRGFQANTVDTKRVLSLFFLGKNIILVEKDRELRVPEYRASLQNLKEKMLCL